MHPSDDRKEMREADEKPVGERPQDRRGREEVVKERDARHLSEEAARETGALQEPGAEADTSMRTGVERRHREGKAGARDPDGRPYGEDWDPDAHGDKGANTGGGAGGP